MRKALLTSVSLFISLGVSSGFFAPLSILKIYNTSSSIENVSYEDLYDSTIESTLANSSAINETELLQQVSNKSSNVSERSLIFINKKLKPLRRVPMKNKFQAFHLSLPRPDNNVIRQDNSISRQDNSFPGQDNGFSRQGNGFPKQDASFPRQDNSFTRKNYGISRPPLDSNRWLLGQKFPQRFVKGPRADLVQTLQRQLYDPNIELKKPQVQSVYRHVYPEKRNQSCMYEEQHDNKLLINDATDIADNPDPKYIPKVPNKVYDIKSEPVDIYHIQKTSNPQSGVSPEQHSKNLVIKSYTNRKPKTQKKVKDQNCGFLKANWFHRKTFNKNEEPNMDMNDLSGIGTYQGNGEDKMDRYIKEALSELQTQIMESDTDNIEGKQVRSIDTNNDVNLITNEQAITRMMREKRQAVLPTGQS